MFERKPLAVAIQRVFSGVAIAATAATPAIIQAQDLEEVTVTGSRIAQDPNLVTSSPVTTVNSEEFAFRGVIRVEDLMNDLPAIIPELTANESNGATGSATLDLRGLGSERTLVLTNGHRMGFGDVFALAPDINQIPGGLIERVEVLTGGASTVYGSDAMAGVVNFVMNDDFEGIQVDYQYSAYDTSADSDIAADIAGSGFIFPDDEFNGDSHNIDLIVGVNSPDGKGNVTAYIGYRNVDPVIQGTRDFSACALNGNVGQGCGGSATIPTGLFSDFAGNYYTVSGTDFIPWDFSFYNYAPPNHIQRPDERYTGGLFAHYEVNEHIEGYAEFMFMDDQSNAQIAPSGAFFVTNTISCDNPFMSAQQAATINGLGYACVPGAGDVVPWYIGRRNVEGGFRNDDLGHTAYRSLVGIRGDITDDWSYDVFANFARTKLTEQYNSDLSTTRIIRALDVVDVGGVPTCQSVVDGSDPTCVPWNIFQTGGVTQAALNYIYIDLYSSGRLKQDQYVGFVSGDLTNMGIVSPWADDGMQIVLGGEYRDEYMSYDPDQGYNSGDGAGQGGPTADVFGGNNTTEFFMEAKIPVVQGREWMESLSLDVGYRYSDYEVGGTTDTWKFAGEWTIVDAFKLRGSYSKASRVANLRELYLPNNLSLWGGSDPCAGAAPTQSAAQCANSGVTAAQYGTIPDNPAGQYNQILGGNIDLAPETSDSWTVGAVIVPDDYIPGLTFSVDYWSITVEDAIDNLDAQTTVNQCGLTGDASLCALINRGANGNLWIGSSATSPNVVATNVNIAFYEVSGIDLVGTYSYDVGDYGSLDFTLRGTWIDSAEQQLTPVSPINVCEGTWGNECGRPTPEWKHVFNVNWNTPWNIVGNLGWRYIGSVDEYDLGRYNADSYHYIDMSMSYTPTWIGYGETTFRIGANNLLDQDPPTSGHFNDVSVYGNGNTIPGTWDAMGRNFFIGVTQRF